MRPFSNLSHRLTLALAAITVAVELLLSAELAAQPLAPKRGFADTGASYNYLQATNAGWYYRWGPNKANIGNFDAEFVPMFWNGGQVTQNNINTIINYGDVEWVLGFNEPERTDQANMSVAQAISAWQTLDNGFDGTGIKLISPGVSDNAAGQQWLASFMSQANSQGLQVDGVAFHWYGVSNPNDPIGAGNSFLSRVDSYWNSYGRPVWITEFAVHDWGNAYTDAEMRAANVTFLNYVIPRLESRSHVAGYAWYNWFGDSTLVEGSPLTPTNVGVEYVGTIKSGSTYDFSGQNLGEHVAYLAGGKLTRTTSASSTVRYINALSGSSAITGTTDWSLASTNWVRVQPGATLRKEGPNQISWSGISVTNNGLIDVAEGTLRLTNNPSFSGSGKLRVSGSGTLSLFGQLGDPTVALNLPVELKGGTISTTMPGGVNVTNGTLVSGAGTIANHLTTQPGSVIRVGDVGVTAPRRILVDDFESYALGNVSSVASPPWTAHQNTSLADIENFSGTKTLTYGWASDFRGASRDLPEGSVIEDDETATIFFRVNSKTDDPDHNVGLGDIANTGAVNFGDFEAQVRFKQGTSAGTFAVDARNGGNFSPTLASGLALNSWYNFWLVIDQSTNSYDVYMNTGTADATGTVPLATGLAFRNGTSDPLNKFLALAGSAPVDNGLRVDDIVFQSGTDLTNPTAGFYPGILLSPATILVQGDFTQLSGAMLELDIFDPSATDSLSVAGNLAAAGTLKVTLDPSAPVPQLGDAFDILDFTTASGEFSVLDLPVLDPGLAWKISDLLTTGEIEVVADVDIDNDGDVDGLDFLAIQIADPALIPAWNELYGSQLLTPLMAVTAAVPEPTSLMLVMWGACAVAIRRTRCG